MSELLFLFFMGFVVAQSASLATTAYLHRSSTHKAIKYHPLIEFFMQLVLWLTTGINRKEWVAVHLCHHAYADIEGDPHSPILLGLWRVQLGNLFLYKKAAKDPKVMAFAKNFEPTWAEKNLFKYPPLGLAVGISLACLVFGWWQGLIVSTVHALLYLFLLNNLINGWCHWRGYKNYADTVAFNNKFIAMITMGEGLHNNHHRYPTMAKLSTKALEFDPGWLFIKTMSVLGLAQVKRSQN